MGLLTLANYNGDDNDNENDNENDLPWAMCFCAYRRAAYGIVSYLLLTPLILIFSFFLSSGFPSPVVSVFAFAAVASVFSSMPAILLSEF